LPSNAREALAEAHDLAGQIYDARSSFEEALAQYESALEYEENTCGQARILKNKAITLLRAGQFESARACAILAREKYELCRNDRGIEQADKVLAYIDREVMDRVKVLERKGLKAASAGRHEEALQFFNQAIEINPQFAHGWNNKGSVLSEMGQYEEALQCHQKAIDIDPSISQAWFNIGGIFFLRQDDEAALRHFDAASRLGNLEARRKAETLRRNSALDREIEEKLRLALIQGGLDGVKYRLRMGVVTLSGEVDTQLKRDQAESIASSIPNVQRVVNELQIREKPADYSG
jgi:tetratricopeptide (TPR) repeat protein